MKLCRFKDKPGEIHVGLLQSQTSVLDLAPAGITRLFPLLESEDALTELNRLTKEKLPSLGLSEIELLAPVEDQEVWAAGVTYLRSKKARMEETAKS